MAGRGLRAVISPGELLDKLSILDIKLARITNPGQLANVRHEHHMLSQLWADYCAQQLSVASDAEAKQSEISALRESLGATNLALWEVEDALRQCEHEQRFDAQFIALARSVYRHNDQRAAIKKSINMLLDAEVIEEKSYASYTSAESDN